GAAHGGLDQAGTRPVVQLAVGDAGSVAGRGPAVAGVAGQRGHVVSEEQTLLLGDLGCCGSGRTHLVLVVLVHAHRGPSVVYSVQRNSVGEGRSGDPADNHICEVTSETVQGKPRTGPGQRRGTACRKPSP